MASRITRRRRPQETLTFATLKDLEIPLWEVFELPGPAEEAFKIGPGPGR